MTWCCVFDSFSAADLSEVLKENARKSQYEKPTPIQKWAIPVIQSRRDLMGCAQTGSGKTVSLACYGIHTHTFNGPLSGTTWVGRYQKGKTNLDFTEARDSEWQWHVCTLLQADNHASTPPVSFFTGRMPFLLPNQQHQSTEGTEYLEVILGTCLQPSFSIVFARGSKQLKVYSTL